jgi:tryptophan synthase alpha chain
MSRIEELFKKKSKAVLSVYCTAGYPKLDSARPLLKALQDGGADMIELGMPYSDPLADGPVIQQSSSQALAQGMTMQLLFEQLVGFRKEISIPVLLMGYMNPVLQFGFDAFCAKASTLGIDGLILPDLPMHEFETEYGPIIQSYGLDFIFLVTPETSEARVRKLDSLSSGFLYAVSSSSTTGQKISMSDQSDYFERLQAMQLKNPVLVGFGISDRKSFQAACRYTRGGIIGTAFIRAIGDAPDLHQATQIFLHGIL